MSIERIERNATLYIYLFGKRGAEDPKKQKKKTYQTRKLKHFRRKHFNQITTRKKQRFVFNLLSIVTKGGKIS